MSSPGAHTCLGLVLSLSISVLRLSAVSTIHFRVFGTSFGAHCVIITQSSVHMVHVVSLRPLTRVVCQFPRVSLACQMDSEDLDQQQESAEVDQALQPSNLGDDAGSESGSQSRLWEFC
jgi:hypothetical protein